MSTDRRSQPRLSLLRLRAGAVRRKHAADEQIHALLDAAADAALVIGTDGRIVYANRRAQALFGRVAAELVGLGIEQLIPERLRAAHVERRRALLADLRVGPIGEDDELSGLRADGSEFPIVMRMSPLVVDGGPLIVVGVRDISVRRATEDALRESALRFTAAFSEAPVGMALVGTDGRVIQVNAALAKMLGHEEKALLGVPLLTLVDVRDEASTELLTGIASGRLGRTQLEVRLLNADGVPIWTLVSASVVRDPAQEPLYFVVHVEDLRDRKLYEGRLEYLANHDPLTGLMNRRRFDEELASRLAVHARYGGGGAVLMLDLDNFKYVNDTLGHTVGDALIRKVAQVLRLRLRDSDILARLGGDEFAALLPAADEAEAVAVAAALLNGVRSDGIIIRGGRRARTTASVGIATFEATRSHTAEEFLSAADLAMYGAKESGRDRFDVYRQDDHKLSKVTEKFEWLERVHTALEQDLFVLEAQPILDLTTSEITQHELLLRMRQAGSDGNGSADTLIRAAAFLDIAERHGLGRAIDRWVIRAAVRIAAEGPPESAASLLEVNLSADSLSDTELAGYIARELDAASVEPHRFVFEVTETAAIANMDTARSLVDQLSNIGCRFALDDFGAGFGSFYYLKYLPFDYLKIDGEFIRKLPESSVDQQIVSSIVTAAHGLGKKTIAEYVEDAATIDLLRDVGVDYAQGYHVGRPASVAERGRPYEARRAGRAGSIPLPRPAAEGASSRDPH